jgi:biotin carboxyl carrier protein
VRLYANVGDVGHAVEVDEGPEAGLIRVTVDGREYLLTASTPAPGVYTLVADGQVFQAFVWERRGRREVQIGPFTASIEVGLAQGRRPAARAAATVSGRQEIAAPMSGRVVQVLAQIGQAVQAGESLVIIEAMKMETEIRTIAPGQVKEVRVEAGMAVEAGQVLLVVE